ncbi:MAG: hypothetical protein A2V77_21905 [Anaeromyxobacter sp. RBG_16_69_14]|nr:MAG: hypothetical protein A2V77_21905 [Anaeromyxobacter sp. RBG_16_69_14]
MTDLDTLHCEIQFRVFSKFKESFGDRFDDLNFMCPGTGKLVKGASLRDVKNGCELGDRLHWN